jgi:hypothetical protein
MTRSHLLTDAVAFHLDTADGHLARATEWLAASAKATDPDWRAWTLGHAIRAHAEAERHAEFASLLLETSACPDPASTSPAPPARRTSASAPLTGWLPDWLSFVRIAR